ncbi:UDP-glucose 4-epimerase [Renibacterium salmoninarum ATCC 33209]|uniref:UDP-glucose 4-epimerase n=1 Tax=Renibacterium salmoninarum (strain ATCC 33209 / DSM 20767 / JCM 11484 / NBRC 15589 / NCIMB 2235) TaxID=288705 RepID=A9WPZ2_RENSM|nr:NAD-dependent epimerase/dehydratase family protein [Renibacterium salmoninarum]ABY22437.1 UDP-glucose 4-epimerase [Renibacterium salmoninarum ATCC 33209]
MRLLVTGGAGFIGSHLIDAALAEGWQVRILDSLDPSVHRSTPSLPDGVELIRGSVTDPHAVLTPLDGVTAVSHQAAKVGLGLNFQDAPDYVAANVHGTAVLLAAMSKRGLRTLVLASSMVVYGEGAYADSRGELVRPGPRTVEDLRNGIFDPRHPVTGELLRPELVAENALLGPRNVYATSKLAQEHLASNWAREVGGRAFALRYQNVYGPRMPRNTPYAGVASIFRSALACGEAPKVFEDGQQRRSFIHVEDIASANVAALQAVQQPGAAFQAYNVGSDTVHTIGELAATLAQLSDGPAPEHAGDYRLGDVRHITASSESIRAELGWRQKWDFEAGMQQFAQAELRD